MKSLLTLSLLFIILSSLQADTIDAKQVYKTKCFMCHITKLITRDQKKGLIG